MKASAAVFLLKPPKRKEVAAPLALRTKLPLAERRDLEMHLLSKLIRRHK